MSFTSLVSARTVTFRESPHLREAYHAGKDLTVNSAKYQQSIFPNRDTSEVKRNANAKSELVGQSCCFGSKDYFLQFMIIILHKA